MNTSLYISSGALNAFQQKIDTTANNVANVNTTGYKRRDHSFSEILANQINNQTKSNQEIGRLTPNGLRVGYGARSGLTQLDTQQGQAIETGNPFDFMIQGNGYFQVGEPASGEVHYSRDGSFHLSPNPANPDSYFLANANGGYLLDQTGKPIELDAKYDVNIDSSGQINLKNKNGLEASFTSAQRVGLVDIQNPSILRNAGGNEFAIDPAALPNGGNVADFVTVQPAGMTQISTGFLEGSNVDLTTEMTELMMAQRNFQMNARAVSYADQMNGIANSILK
ncbi:flagellar hook-basal body protein [Neobacillus sp. MM2021_6]|uniref:flagellar hook-basal body protein n=1 Tax=Bacillaceae TaxID=186817 RepID=UPI00140AF58F|nr:MULTISPECIES: flagellar hook-basal body protein [Bacillaceae]MBO0962796.1 flagellar hook-basal body protein [Neobacillus sp. MM2021_6]NHC21077.1 flagellar hook-basal body protein [Bacillus sp. MM2020_4]